MITSADQRRKEENFISPKSASQKESILYTEEEPTGSSKQGEPEGATEFDLEVVDAANDRDIEWQSEARISPILAPYKPERIFFLCRAFLNP